MRRLIDFLANKKLKDIYYLMTKYTIGIYVIMALVFLGAHESFMRLNSILENNLKYIDAVDSMERASDELTTQARRFVVVGDRQALQLYYDEVMVTNRRYKAVQILSSADKDDVTDFEMLNFRSAWQSSISLSHSEIYAMKLAANARGQDVQNQLNQMFVTELSQEDKALSPQDKLSKAITMLYDGEYEKQKNLIDDYLNSTMSSFRAEVAREKDSRTTAYQVMIFVLFLSLCALLLFNILSIWISRQLLAKPVEHFVESIARSEPCPLEGTAEMRILATAYNEQYFINRARQSDLSHKANYDELTGTLNRRVFSEMLTNIETTGKGALLIIDVDKFKDINDTYGHATGDLLLRRISSLLKVYFLDPNMHVARFGGDEFAVLISDVCGNEDVLKSRIVKTAQILNRILQYTADAEMPPASLSIGVAFSVDTEGTNKTLFECADTALYQVKFHGRHGVNIYKREK